MENNLIKKTLKIDFSDFWFGFDKNNNLIKKYLDQYYTIEISNKPDVLIFSSFGKKHLAYKCPKIYYTGENERPNFNFCDYAFTFDYDSFAGKNFRFPLYRWQVTLEDLCNPKDVDEIVKQKTKFCCMLISNPNGKERNEFFEKLSKYKVVDSGGAYKNNIGGLVKDKNEFIKDYKFVFAFENSSFPGYTTEKIAEPMFKNSIPIYWGNELIAKEFNKNSFINIHDFKNFDEAINKIIEIDNDTALFKSYLGAYYFENNVVPENLQHSYFADAWHNAIEIVLNKKPVNTGVRRVLNYLTVYTKDVLFKIKFKLSIGK